MVSSLSVIGLGKLGAPMAACLAARGFSVDAVDSDSKKVDAIGRGVPPVHEPGLEELLRESNGRISASRDIEGAVYASDATFVVVATPSEPDGGFSLRYVLPSCQAIGCTLATKKTFHLVVLTSTVMPGSTGGVIKAALERASGKRCGVDFGLCYSPESIALGTVIRDFYNPDFLLIGESDPRSGEILSDTLQAQLQEFACHRADELDQRGNHQARGEHLHHEAGPSVSYNSLGKPCAQVVGLSRCAHT
jgi:UDPglucose 6-dehydrogenase